MSITLVTGPANAGKAQVVMDAVRAPPRARRGAAARRADARRRRALPARAGRRGRALGVRVERFGGLIARSSAAPGVRERGARRRSRASACSAPLRAARAAPAARSAGLRARARRAVRRAASSRASTPRAPRGGARGLRCGDGAAALGVELAARSTAPTGGALERLGRLDRRAARPCARSTRCARAPRCGARTPVLFYGFDDLDAAAARRDRDARRASSTRR